MNTFLSLPKFPTAFLLVLPILAAFPGHLSAAGEQTYADWLVANSIPEANNGPEDRNGPLNLTNLEAFAYGVNPLEATRADLPRLAGASATTGLSVFYRRNTAAQDLAMEFESSADLAGWAEAIPESEQVLWTVDNVEGREAIIAWESTAPLFVRIAMALASPSSLARIEGGTLPALSTIGPLDVASFSISKFEVTWAEWLHVRTWATANGYDLDGIGSSCSDNHPVQTVNWYDVVKWCNARSEMEGLTPVYTVAGAVYKVEDFGPDGSGVVAWDQQANGYRLPTDAEWEYAARGGQLTNNYIYSGGDDLDQVGWWRGNSGGAECALDNGVAGPTDDGAGTWPVGQKTPNELGLHDMSGNVWEWCWDPRDDTFKSRRIRGGSWLFFEGSALLVSRNSYRPSDRYYYAGFRVARN